MSQAEMFEDYKNDWQKEWEKMPEFEYVDKEPVQQIIVSFKIFADVVEFGKLVDQSVTPNTKNMWYPKQNNIKPGNFAYVDQD